MFERAGGIHHCVPTTSHNTPITQTRTNGAHTMLHGGSQPPQVRPLVMCFMWIKKEGAVITYLKSNVGYIFVKVRIYMYI